MCTAFVFCIRIFCARTVSIFIVPYFPDKVELKRPQAPVNTYTPAGEWTQWSELVEDITEADKTSYSVIVNICQELEPA